MSVYLSNLSAATLGAVDIKDMIKSATVNIVFEEVDITAMGDTARRFAAGLEASNVSLEFLNDTTDSPTINAFAGQAKVLVLTENGKTYTGTVLVNNLQPINGAVGDMSTQSITFNYVSAVVTS